MENNKNLKMSFLSQETAMLAELLSVCYNMKQSAVEGWLWFCLSLWM